MLEGACISGVSDNVFKWSETSVGTFRVTEKTCKSLIFSLLNWLPNEVFGRTDSHESVGPSISLVMLGFFAKKLKFKFDN
jgi:hypothetical protein